MSMADAAVTIIGGGVVGLAVATELAQHFSPLFILERREKYGQETSSRNSEVIHAGIYYPHNSLKARLCVEGKEILYKICEDHSIPCKKITKIISAGDNDELDDLDRLLVHGRGNGVELERLSAKQVRHLEPHIRSAGGILSPTTGIISVHDLMDFYFHRAKIAGAQTQLRCEVVGLEKRHDDFLITIKEGEEASRFSSEWVINSAGLECDTIASLAGIDVDAAGYRLHYCKGSYFSIQGPMSRSINHLVYPLPRRASLGVHAVLDLAGRLKFGPDVEFLTDREVDYSVDQSKQASFADSVRRILPDVKDEDLVPDMSGIRPKLQARGEDPHDFIIVHEIARNLSGLINLIGIESPGLTASPAIARYVRNLMAG